MTKETFLVVLSYTKNVGEMIDSILNTESVVASKGVSKGAKIEDTAPDTGKNGGDASEVISNTPRNSQIKEALFQIRKLLRYGTIEDIKPILPTAHSHQADFQTRIKKLMDDNERLRVQNETFENANNGLICEVDTKQTELEASKDEMRRFKKKRSQLKDIKEHLELSRKSSNDAFKLLSSLKKEDNTNQDNVLTLKKELKAYQADREEAINSKHQHKGCEKKYSALVEDNKHLEKRIAGFKRKLEDVMTDIERSTINKRRQRAV